MSLGEAGDDELLRVLGQARGCAAMTEVVQDESGEVAAVLAVAGTPRRGVFGVAHRERLALLAGRVETALNHVTSRMLLNASTALLASSLVSR